MFVTAGRHLIIIPKSVLRLEDQFIMISVEGSLFQQTDFQNVCSLLTYLPIVRKNLYSLAAEPDPVASAYRPKPELLLKEQVEKLLQESLYLETTMLGLEIYAKSFWVMFKWYWSQPNVRFC